MIGPNEMQAHREMLRERSRDEAESIVKLAGFTILATWELANGYWPDAPHYDEVRKPWWLFLTEYGPIRLGWRKRVLEIEWSTCKVRAVVTSDDVTKGNTMVHAYSVDKAVGYLRELRRIAGATQ